jgi:hypothetical protein
MSTTLAMTDSARIEHVARQLRSAETLADDRRRALRDEVSFAIRSGAFTRREIAEACGLSWPAAYSALDHADRDAFQSLADARAGDTNRSVA